mmetsp:Transcript_13681/g.32693  ORF Transcript_13681/g.32693 Transcript_13681/m.32693 type:complete len:188 (+) Transcript_13681:44-607(+)
MVAAAGGRWAALYNDAKEYFADGGIQLDKYLILKVSSVVAGALMILAGMIGSSALFLGGGFAYFIGSLYAIAFGVLVQVIEIKNKYGDPPERIKPLYKLLDFYLKFLTLQRGKGLFYMGAAGPIGPSFSRSRGRAGRCLPSLCSSDLSVAFAGVLISRPNHWQALDSSAFTLLPRPESHHGLEAGAR